MDRHYIVYQNRNIEQKDLQTLIDHHFKIVFADTGRIVVNDFTIYLLASCHVLYAFSSYHPSALPPFYPLAHSFLSASTGFRVAARQVFQVTVKIAIAVTINPVKANIHQLTVV